MKNIILCLLVTCGLSLSFTGSYSTTNFPNGVSTGTLNATNAVVVGVTNVSTIGDGYATINGPMTVAGTVTANKFAGDGSGLTNLSIAGSVTLTGNVNAVNGNFSGNVSANSYTAAQGLQLGDTYQIKWGSGVPNSYLYGNSSTKTLGFGTNQNDRMVISQNGNVGINNANPLQALDVNGTVSASALQVNGNLNFGGNRFFVGSTAGTAGATGNYNFAYGPSALNSLGSGSNWNWAYGSEALRQTTFGGNNIAMGWTSAKQNTTGTDLIALGEFALRDNVTGNYNIGIGYAAGYTNNQIDNCIFIGRSTGSNTTTVRMTGSAAIGDNTKIDRDNAIAIGASGVNVGISGVSNPSTALEVAGTVSANQLSLSGQNYCSLYRSTAQSIPDTTWTVVTWDTEDSDLYAMHTANSGTINVLSTGTYLITATGGFVANAVGSRILNVLINGVDATSSTGAANTTLYTQLSTSIVKRLNINDQITARQWQSSTGALNTQGAINQECIQVQKLF